MYPHYYNIMCPYLNKSRGKMHRNSPDYYLKEMVKINRQKTFTAKEALEIGGAIGIDFKKIDPEQFRRGLEVEMEHGTMFPEANVTNDDPILTGKIALAHLLEIPDYYTRLDKMEKEAMAELG